MAQVCILAFSMILHGSKSLSVLVVTVCFVNVCIDYIIRKEKCKDCEAVCCPTFFPGGGYFGPLLLSCFWCAVWKGAGVRFLPLQIL